MWGPYDAYRGKSNWKKAATAARTLTQGAFRGAYPLTSAYYLESLDPRHRYGPNLNDKHAIWKNSNSPMSFFNWLDKEIFASTEVRYLDPPELPNYRATFSNGRVVLNEKYFEGWKSWIENRKTDTELIFVMDAKNQVYVGIKMRGTFHHSSFMGGKPVKAAGTITVNPQWQILLVSNLSGHYRPDILGMTTLLTLIKRDKFKLENLKFAYYVGNNCAFNGSAAEWLITYGGAVPGASASSAAPGPAASAAAAAKR